MIKFLLFNNLIIINFFGKHLLDRERPIININKNKNIHFITDICLSINWQKNQSFPSGHVAYTYSVLYIINNYLNYSLLTYFYILILFLACFCRINKGAHHFLDVILSIVIIEFVNKLENI